MLLLGTLHLLFGFFSSWQVGDGQAALDALTLGCFDLLVLDLGLPKKTGMQVRW